MPWNKNSLFFAIIGKKVFTNNASQGRKGQDLRFFLIWGDCLFPNVKEFRGGRSFSLEEEKATRLSFREEKRSLARVQARAGECNFRAFLPKKEGFRILLGLRR
jgi:hypothetical protein